MKHSLFRRVGAVIICVLLAALAVIWRRHGQLGASSQPAVPASQVQAQASQTPPAAAPASKPYARDAFLEAHQLGTAWGHESQPSLRSFSQWADAFVATPAAARPQLTATGLAAARNRREALHELIKTDPQAALAAAVPWTVRQQLPAEVQALLEERVSAKGDLYSEGALPAPGRSVARAYWQVAEVDGRFLDAYTYGDRQRHQNEYRRDLAIHGIAIEGDLAVLDSDVRVLDAGEPAPASKPLDPICGTSGLTSPTSPGTALNTDLADASKPVAVDTGDQVMIVCRRSHVPQPESPDKWLVLAAGGSSVPVAGSSDLSKPATNLCLGEHKSLIIRVDTSDMVDAVTNFTPEVLVNDFMRPNGVNDWYIFNSHGLASNPLYATNVTPVYRLPSTMEYYKTNGGSSPLHSDARALATAAGYVMSNYNHIYVMHPKSYDAPGVSNKLDYAGLGSVGGPNIWLNGYDDFYVIAHEAGHNFGLLHANRWAPTNNLPLGDAATLNTLPSGYSALSLSTEYGDSNDMMAGGFDSRYWFNPWFATYVRWLPDAIAPGVGESGIYRLYRYDHQDADTNRTFAIKIQRDGVKDYWLSYRRQFTNDTAKTIGNGAYVFFGYHSYRQNDWIRMDSSNWALTNGQTLNDTDAGIAFTTVAQGGAGVAEYLDVKVQFVPQIEWANTNVSVAATNGSVTLTLQRSRDFNGSVTANFQTESLTATSGVDFTGTTNSVTWVPYDRADKTVTIPVFAAATNGAQFRVRLTGVTGGMTRNGDSSVVTFGAGSGSLVSGGLWRQFYANIGGSDISDLTNSLNFPNFPDSASVVTNVETSANQADNFGQRLIGFITPPQTANYRFWAAGDDTAQVFLGSSALPSSKSRIINMTFATGARSYGFSSSTIALTGGQKYYFEVWHKEGSGSDSLAIAWRTNSSSQPSSGSEPIPGALLSYIQGGDITPRLTTNPSNTQAAVSGSATFTAVAVGASPLKYQWRHSGTNLPNATNATYTLGSAAAGDAGNYDLIVTNTYGSITSSVAALTLGSAPAVTIHPVSTNLGTGQSTTLTVSATGAALSYQWRFNGTPLGNSTSSSLLIPVVGLGQAGNYDVVVANSLGSVTSAVAVVAVFAAPGIVSDPASVAANPGGFAQFTVSASGASPLAYQWRKNGTTIAGATQASLALAGVSTNDVGSYDVIVTNAYGSVTSALAALSVSTAGNVAVGGLWLDYFAGITCTNTVNPPMSDLTNNASYPNSPTTNGVIKSFETPRNRGVTYGQRITGYVLPPVTGNYRFMLAADQAGQLYLSTDATAANKQLIAQNPTRVGWRSWDSAVYGASSALIALTAGQRYYVEVLQVNPAFDPYQGYVDNLGVSWQLPTNSAPPHSGSAPIPGIYLAYDQRTLPAASITTQPATQLVPYGGTANFTVIATNASGYIWRKNGTPIPGANNSALVIPGITNSDVAGYDVIVGGLGGSVTSSVVQVVIGSIPSSALTSNLVAYLPFDTDYLDYSGRQNHPAQVGTTLRAAGNLGGNAFVLTNSGYLTFGLAPDLHFNNDSTGNTNSFSISFWAKIPSGSYFSNAPYVANKDWAADANTGWALSAGPGTSANGFFQMNFKESNANSRDYDATSATLTNNTWHHYAVVFTRDGTRTCYTYIDGTLADSRTMFASGINIDGSALPLNLGQDGTGAGTRGRWTNALMDDFGFWRRSLSATDVSAIYKAGTNGYSLAYAEATPVITNQPADATVALGGTLNLSVGAVSANPMTYQWRTNGIAIPGATNSTFSKSGLTSAHFAGYDVIVSNLYGATISRTAAVTQPRTGSVGGFVDAQANPLLINFNAGYGSAYNVQRSTNLVSWITILTTNAPSSGTFRCSDNFNDLGSRPQSAYYRLTWTP